jgi:DNA-binding transcriptional LysR family regulator
MLCEHEVMDLPQLRYFQAVARHQHVSRVHLDVPCRRTLSLVWRAGAYRPAAARALAGFAAGYFRTWRGGA